MNMTSSGIGWGVTQNYPNYRGATISAPVGCVVIVTTNSDTYTGKAKFNGTFAILSLGSNSAPTVGSSLPLLSLYSYTGTDDYGDSYTAYMSGGAFIRLS